MKTSQVVIPVSDHSHVGEIRRRTKSLAGEAGLNEAEAGKAAIVATELATNLSRHATGGEMIVGYSKNDTDGWVELVSVDRGPGIADVARCFEDGFSTGGGPGNGLGAVRRLSTECDLYSSPETDSGPGGTVVFARIAANRPDTVSGPFAWGIVTRPAPYETCSGDAWRVAERAGELTLMVADGLGHGPEAAAAADQAVDVFDAEPFAPLTTLLQNAGIRMQGTRGGAVAVARVDASSRMVKFVGIGNIAGSLRLLNEKKGRGLVSHNGVVGGQVRRIQEFDYPCDGHSLLVMHSDGLRSRWDLDAYSGLISRHPAVIAGVLYRDFTRGRDDVTVAVVRLRVA